MNNKAAKKLRKLAKLIANTNGTPEREATIYNRLKVVHKDNKKTPN